MEEHVDPQPIIWIGITNEILAPAPNGPLQAPVALSARDASNFLLAFQHLVYLTVLLGGEPGRKSTKELTKAEIQQYELVIQEIQIGSFFSGFRWHEDVQDLWDSANKTLTVTIEWSSKVANKLATSEWVANAADVTPDALILVTEVVLPIIQAHTGHGVYVTTEQAMAVVNALAAFVRLSRKTNRRASIRHGGEEWKPSKAEVDAVLRAEKELQAHTDNRFNTEVRTFGPSRGTIMNGDPANRNLYIRFPDYYDPIVCQYSSSESHMLARLQEGDSIEVEGIALHVHGDPIEVKPLLVKINDWGDLQHRYPDQYKM